MTTYFDTLTIAGADLTDPVSGEIVTTEKIADHVRDHVCSPTVVNAIDVALPRAADILSREGHVVISPENISDLEQWAPPGRETLIVAHHEDSDTLIETDYGRIGTLLKLAGIPAHDPLASSRAILHLLEESHGAWEQFAVSDDDVWFNNTDLLRHVRRLAITRIGGRQVRVLTTTSRPLLGLDSTLALGPDTLPTTGLAAEVIPRLTQFYTKYTMISEAENLTRSEVGSYARLPGSGAGQGLAALTNGIRGTVMPLAEQLLSLPTNAEKINQSDLIITTIKSLHPQTVHDSHIGPLGEMAAAQATPLIAFTNETSLSRHEQAEWGLHAVYQVPSGNVCSYIGRVLSSTWLRTDVR